MIRCRRPRLAALAVALAMAAPGPAAWAAEPAPVGDDRAAFDALVEEARVARAAGDLERALAALERAYALSGSAAVLNNVAVTLADLGRYGDAAAAAASLAAHPDVPPGRKDQVDALAAELAGKAARGWLRVALDPGATAANGGRALSPDADAEVPPGRVVIDVVGDAAAARVAVDAPAGRRVAVDLRWANLRADLGAVDVSALPSPVAIDGVGAPAGVARVWLAPGAHRVRAADGAEREVALHRGEVVTLAPRPPDDGPGVGPLVLGAAGVVALGVGVGLTLDASGRRDDLRDDLAGDGPVRGLSRADALSRQDDADRRATIGGVALGVGAAAAVGALLWLALDGGGDGDARLDVVGTAGAGGWVVRW